MLLIEVVLAALAAGDGDYDRSTGKVGRPRPNPAAAGYGRLSPPDDGRHAGRRVRLHRPSGDGRRRLRALGRKRPDVRERGRHLPRFPGGNATRIGARFSPGAGFVVRPVRRRCGRAGALERAPHGLDVRQSLRRELRWWRVRCQPRRGPPIAMVPLPDGCRNGAYGRVASRPIPPTNGDHAGGPARGDGPRTAGARVCGSGFWEQRSGRAL